MKARQAVMSLPKSLTSSGPQSTLRTCTPIRPPVLRFSRVVCGAPLETRTVPEVVWRPLSLIGLTMAPTTQK